MARVALHSTGTSRSRTALAAASSTQDGLPAVPRLVETVELCL